MAQRFQRGPDGGRQACSRPRGFGLDADDDDLLSAVRKKFGQLAEGGGVSAEFAHLDGFGRESPERSGGGPHIGGIQKYQNLRMEPADHAGIIFRDRARIDALPVRMPEGAGENRPEGIIAMPGVSNAEQ